MAAACENVFQPLPVQHQMTSMYSGDFVYQVPSAPQMVDTTYPAPFGYRTETEYTGEAFSLQHTEPHEGSGFHMPHLQPAMTSYQHPNQLDFQSHYMGSIYRLPYAHQRMQVFHEQPAMHEMYRHVEPQHFGSMQRPNHGWYHPQYAHLDVPQFQDLYYLQSRVPIDRHHQHHSTDSQEMITSTSLPFVEDRNTCADVISYKRNQGYQSKPPKRSGPHNCQFANCGRVYTQSALLNAHLRTHTDEKIYKCNWRGCGREFSSSDELSRHLRKHTAQRYFRRRTSHFNNLENP